MLLRSIDVRDVQLLNLLLLFISVMFGNYDNSLNVTMLEPLNLPLNDVIELTVAYVIPTPSPKLVANIDATVGS
jgi:hypothetical protein